MKIHQDTEPHKRSLYVFRSGRRVICTFSCFAWTEPAFLYEFKQMKYPLSVVRSDGNKNAHSLQ
jgi:hypothetical protein